MNFIGFMFNRNDPNSTKVVNDKDIWSNFEKDFSDAATKTILEDVYKNLGKKLVANYHDHYKTATINNI